MERPARLDAVGAHLLVFIGVAAIVILVPGPDTAVVTKNVLVHGRRAAFGTSLGVSAGLSVWTLAAAVGVASVVRASALAFTALKLIGALYLVWLGVQALRAAGHAESGARPVTADTRAMGALGGFRQGFLSDLANPKIGIFFTSLLPQFVDPGHSVLVPFLALGAVFVLMTVLWLSAYCLIAARAAGTLQRPRVKAAMDRVTGTVLIALGLRLAIEHR
jgi:RhtB (resistance to homoserine/threonine) family protein